VIRMPQRSFRRSVRVFFTESLLCTGDHANMAVTAPGVAAHIARIPPILADRIECVLPNEQCAALGTIIHHVTRRSVEQRKCVAQSRGKEYTENAEQRHDGRKDRSEHLQEAQGCAARAADGN